MIPIFLIAGLSLLAQLVLPWWSLAIVAFAVCFWQSTGTKERASSDQASHKSGAGSAFLYGFAGVALVWLVYALLIHFRTDGIFTGRMSQLLFKANASAGLVVATAVLGGIVGGAAGLAGHFTQRALANQPAVRNS